MGDKGRDDSWIHRVIPNRGLAGRGSRDAGTKRPAVEGYIGGTVWDHEPDGPQQLSPKPLGLSLVYNPESREPLADFIFIHGLRGDPVLSWCQGRSEEKFWPQKWLHLHPAFENVRIWTFGYNSDWISVGSGNVSGISDFGRLLLYHMKVEALKMPREYQIGKVSAHTIVRYPSRVGGISLRV